MKRSVPALLSRSLLLLSALLATCPIVTAQDAEQQHKLGLRLFNQSCRVCHTKPQVISPQYAPVLSMNTLGGNAGVMREVISNGTPRMPGFKYDLKPAEIDAVVAYIKTIPAPAQTPAAAPTKAGASRDAD